MEKEKNNRKENTGRENTQKKQKNRWNLRQNRETNPVIWVSPLAGVDTFCWKKHEIGNSIDHSGF